MRAHEFIVEYNRDITLRNRKVSDGIFLMYHTNINIPEEKKRVLMQDREYYNSVLNRVMTEIESVDIPGVPKNYYAPWLAREYANGYFYPTTWTTEMTPQWRFRSVIPTLEAFHKYKDKSWFPQYYRDIYKFNPPQLTDFITDLYIPEKKTTNRGRSEVVLDTDAVRVVHLLDRDAAIYYGQGTNPRWCTSYTDSDNRFDQYNSEGPLYVLLPKKPEPTGEKYQIHLHSNSGGARDEYTDEHNKMVSSITLIQRFGKEFAEWFISKRPLLKDSVFMSPDSLIEELWEGLSRWYKNRYERYIRDQLESNTDDWHSPEELKKEVHDFWIDMSATPVRKIKAAALESAEDDGSIWDIDSGLPWLWNEIGEKHAKLYGLSIKPGELSYTQPYIVKIEDHKSGNNPVTQNRQFFVDERVGDYYIGTLGGYKNN